MHKGHFQLNPVLSLSILTLWEVIFNFKPINTGLLLSVSIHWITYNTQRPQLSWSNCFSSPMLRPKLVHHPPTETFCRTLQIYRPGGKWSVRMRRIKAMKTLKLKSNSPFSLNKRYRTRTLQIIARLPLLTLQQPSMKLPRSRAMGEEGSLDLF